MGKRHEIQIPVSINKVLLEHSLAHSLVQHLVAWNECSREKHPVTTAKKCCRALCGGQRRAV